MVCRRVIYDDYHHDEGEGETARVAGNDRGKKKERERESEDRQEEDPEPEKCQNIHGNEVNGLAPRKKYYSV